MWYAILAIPATLMLLQLGLEHASAGELLHGSGETSARLMILALAITPLRQLLPRARWTAWLLRHRRVFGVSAFAYGAFHAILYLVDLNSLEFVLAEIGALGIWTGWLALLVFVPLAVTSNDAMLRWLGARRWKILHRTVYIAAIAVLIHWIYVHNNAVAAWLHFSALIILELARVFRSLIR